MPDVLEQARAVIEARLREIEAEAQRLRKALKGMGGDGRRRPMRRTSRPAARDARRAAARAPRGQRQTEFLGILEKSPGAKVPDVARKMGVSAKQVYGLAGRLHRSGKIRKRRGGGYTVKS